MMINLFSNNNQATFRICLALQCQTTLIWHKHIVANVLCRGGCVCFKVRFISDLLNSNPGSDP